jgi:hypothetical protein
MHHKCIIYFSLYLSRYLETNKPFDDKHSFNMYLSIIYSVKMHITCRKCTLVGSNGNSISTPVCPYSMVFSSTPISDQLLSKLS